MKNAKKYLKLMTVIPLLALFFLVFSSVKSDAAARTVTYVGWWHNFSSIPVVEKNRTIEIEVGQSFELAPYFLYQTNTYSGSSLTAIKGKTGEKLSMTFVSSKPAVASVNKKKGTVAAKKAGTAKITASYKGKKYVCTLKVKKKGSLGMTTTYKKLNNAAKALVKYQNTKITSKNIAAILPKYVSYLNQLIPLDDKIVYGFEMASDISSMNKLVLPCERQVLAAEEHVLDYLNANNPSSVFKISSASGKGGSGSIAVKLNKKPTKLQINILQVLNRDHSETVKLSSSTAEMLVSVYCDGYVGDDEDNPDRWSWKTLSYYADCKIKAGTASATISNIRESEGSPVKLKKDYKYRIELNGKEVTFTAK